MWYGSVHGPGHDAGCTLVADSNDRRHRDAVIVPENRLKVCGRCCGSLFDGEGDGADAGGLEQNSHAAVPELAFMQGGQCHRQC